MLRSHLFMLDVVHNYITPLHPDDVSEGLGCVGDAGSRHHSGGLPRLRLPLPLRRILHNQHLLAVVQGPMRNVPKHHCGSKSGTNHCGRKSGTNRSIKAL